MVGMLVVGKEANPAGARVLGLLLLVGMAGRDGSQPRLCCLPQMLFKPVLLFFFLLLLLLLLLHSGFRNNVQNMIS
jgi:hypothetical protein